MHQKPNKHQTKGKKGLTKLLVTKLFQNLVFSPRTKFWLVKVPQLFSIKVFSLKQKFDQSMSLNFLKFRFLVPEQKFEPCYFLLFNVFQGLKGLGTLTNQLKILETKNLSNL